MEAKSLADLNVLAGNPPSYCAETEGRKKPEPLVLYIARVPHTNDVILSTLKPQERNVTDQDVLSALYYVHLEPPSNDAEAPEPLRDEKTYRSSEDSGRSPQTIARKPLPGSARPLTPDSLPHGVHTSQQITDLTSATLPQTGDGSGNGATINHHVSTNGPDRTAAGLHTGMPSRKPVGPRPMKANPVPSEPAVAHDCSAPEKDGNEKQYNPTIPPLDTSVPPASAGNSHIHVSPIRPRPMQQSHSRSPSPRKRCMASTGNPFTLTIIRKDPSTSSQWNVGRVYSRQLDQLLAQPESNIPFLQTSSFKSSTSSTRYPPIDIDLETSGYAKFRNMAFKINSPNEEGGMGTPVAVRPSIDERSTMRGEIGVFSRRVAMEYTKSFKTNMKEAFHNVGEVTMSAINRHRSDSITSNASQKGDAPAMPDTIITSGPPPEGMKARGYTFQSPWDGKCVFQTQMDGKSVVCQHSLDNPNSESAMVSELRFNLLSSPEQTNGSKGARENFSNLFKVGGVAKESGIGGEPFYTNVGAEHAGGGRNGREAKLGKLIIYDVGLKMLDLLVASNMGIWWGAWEKHF